MLNCHIGYGVSCPINSNLKQEQEGQLDLYTTTPRMQPKGGDSGLPDSPQLYDNSLKENKGDNGTFRL